MFFQQTIINMSRNVKVLKYFVNRCHLYLARVMKVSAGEENFFGLGPWRLAGWRNSCDI